jgi:hypothetical protein
MPSVADFLQVLGETLRDVLPLAAILATFQLFVLRRPLPNPKRLLLGLSYVLGGLVLFLMGLELGPPNSRLPTFSVQRVKEIWLRATPGPMAGSTPSRSPSASAPRSPSQL